MAKRVLVQLVDDIDDQPIESGGEHITFAVNGNAYEIDLRDDHALEFRRKFDYYISKSKRVRNTSTRQSVETPSARSAIQRDPAQTRAIREWATANGMNVSARGRIPAEIERAFEAAH